MITGIRNCRCSDSRQPSTDICSKYIQGIGIVQRTTTDGSARYSWSNSFFVPKPPAGAIFYLTRSSGLSLPELFRHVGPGALCLHPTPLKRTNPGAVYGTHQSSTTPSATNCTWFEVDWISDWSRVLNSKIQKSLCGRLKGCAARSATLRNRYMFMYIQYTANICPRLECSPRWVTSNGEQLVFVHGNDSDTIVTHPPLSHVRKPVVPTTVILLQDENSYLLYRLFCLRHHMVKINSTSFHAQIP